MTDKGTYLSLRVVPNSKKTEVIGPLGDSLKIKIQAPPLDGKANAEIIDFLARHFSIRKNSVTIVSGETSRSKRVLVSESIDPRTLLS